MATTLTLTPSLTNGVAQELNDRDPFYIAQDGLGLPVVAYDEEYAESIYSEGGRRTRSRPQNPSGTVRLWAIADSVSTLRDDLDALEQTVEACRVYGGELALTLEDTTTVTYDLESISMTAADPSALDFGRFSVELTVTTHPYGRLDPVTLVTNATSSDPIQSVSLAGIDGSAPALIEATITDTATQSRDHLEVGLDADLPAQDDYAAAVLADTPSLYWRLGSSGTTDQSGNSRDGTASGGITIGGVSPGAIIGDTDAATDFDGSNDKITSSYNPFANGSTRTFEGWAYRDTSSGSDSLFGGDGATHPYARLESGSNDVRFDPASGGAVTTWSDAWPGNGLWVHFAFVFDESANTVALYINGSLVSSQTESTAYDASPGNFVLGARGSGSDPFDGKMDEVAIYGSALSAARIKAHFDLGRQNYTTPLLIDSASLSTTGLAGSATTRTGAYTSTGVIRTTLGPDAIALCEATGLSHKGRHRAKLRVYGTGTGPIYVRVAYRVASGAWSRNSWVRVPALDAFYEIDCGVVTANGNGTLSVRVEAYSALTTFVDTLDIDYLLMIPAYRWAKAKGTADTITTTYGARDQFSQSAAPLVGAYTTNGVSAATNASPIVVTSNSHGLSNGDEVWIEGVSGNTAANGIWTVANKTTDTFELSGSTGNGAYTSGGTISKPGLTADVGGKWHGAGIIGAAAADSFQVEATGHTAQRTAVSDSSLDSGGSYAILGSTAAACKVQATVKFSIPLFSVAHYRFGLLARYVDADNWAALVLCDEYPAGELHLYKKASGTVSRVAGSLPSSYLATTNLAHALRLEIDANGAYRGYWFDNLLLSGADSVFATGGVLASGKCGLYDAYTSATASTRNYDDYLQTGPSATVNYQHVIDASGAVVLDDDSIARSDGTRPPRFEGAYLTAPPAGREDRTHRLAVKMRRTDIDNGPDSEIGDPQRVDVTVTPRVLLL